MPRRVRRLAEVVLREVAEEVSSLQREVAEAEAELRQ